MVPRRACSLLQCTRTIDSGIQGAHRKVSRIGSCQKVPADDQGAEPVTDLRRPDDDVLIAGALRGDEEALGQLLAQDQEWAYNVAYRVLGQDADARDAVQDAFLQTVRAIRGDGSPPRSIATYRPWLRRVVSNAAITQIRRRPSVAAVSDEAVAHPIWGPGHDEPGRSIEREETRAQVLQALLALPETQRAALALRELLDASYDEIAEALDLTRTAVGTLLFRARAGFRASYDRVSEGAPPRDCPDLVPLFASIVDDQPRPEAWQQLEAHLGDCERCKRDLEGQRGARRLFALLPLLALPAGWNPVRAAMQGLATGAAAGGAGVESSAASGAAAAPSGGLTAGGLAVGGAGAKALIASLATAAVVGTAVVAGPLVGPGTDPVPSGSPAVGITGSPVASPEPQANASPGTTAPISASPTVTTVPAPSSAAQARSDAQGAGPAPAGGQSAPVVSPSVPVLGSPAPVPASSPSPSLTGYPHN
jgi:RNA polymerase sigma-70 factor (ECF subfamily)